MFVNDNNCVYCDTEQVTFGEWPLPHTSQPFVFPSPLLKYTEPWLYLLLLWVWNLVSYPKEGEQKFMVS